MAVSSFATAAASTDEGGTLVASATVVESGSKVAAAVSAGTYSITFYGNSVLNVYSYTSTGAGTFLGSIDASSAGSNSVIATVSVTSTGFAFSGATGTVVIRKFAASQAGSIVDGTATALAAGISTTAYAHRNAYSGSRWVAICSYESGTTTNKVGYSDDGLFWKFGANMPASLYWADITYGNGMFVAIAGNNWASNSNTNVVVTSTDGITWTQRTLPTTTYWSGITYGNGKFVAVSGGTATSSSAAAYSTDGVTWTAATLPASYQWTDIEYGNGIFVAIATGSNNLATSTDGINWTARTFATTGSWRRIVWAGTRFVVIGSYSSYTQLSTDGITWTNGSVFSGGASYEWHAMDYVNGVVLVGNTNYSYMAYSTDAGNTWNSVYSPATYLMSFLWTGSTYVAIASSASYSEQSTNLSSWSYIGTGASQNNGGLYYVNGRYVALNAGTSNIYVSTDGLSWTAQSVGTSQNWNSITYGNGIYVMTIGDTSNGSTQSAYVYTSPNLTTWTQRSLPNTYAWKRAVFGNGKFVIPSGYSGVPQTPVASSDGINWSYTTGNSTYGNILCFGKGRFVMLPQYQATQGATSVDGVNWTIFELPVGVAFTSVAYGNGIFVAIATTWATGGGLLWTSTDGVTWVKQSAYNPSSVTANTQIAFANGYFGFVWNSKAHISTNGKTWTLSDLGGNYPMAAGGPQGIVFASDGGSGFAKTGTKITIS